MGRWTWNSECGGGGGEEGGWGSDDEVSEERFYKVKGMVEYKINLYMIMLSYE